MLNHARQAIICHFEDWQSGVEGPMGHPALQERHIGGHWYQGTQRLSPTNRTTPKAQWQTKCLKDTGTPKVLLTGAYALITDAPDKHTKRNKVGQRTLQSLTHESPDRKHLAGTEARRAVSREADEDRASTFPPPFGPPTPRVSLAPKPRKSQL